MSMPDEIFVWKNPDGNEEMNPGGDEETEASTRYIRTDIHEAEVRALTEANRQLLADVKSCTRGDCSELQTLRAEVQALRDAVRFLASTWNEIDKFVYEHCRDALGQYPVIQGTANQLKLRRIGEQPYSQDRLHLAFQQLDDELKEQADD